MFLCPLLVQVDSSQKHELQHHLRPSWLVSGPQVHPWQPQPELNGPASTQYETEKAGKLVTAQLISSALKIAALQVCNKSGPCRATKKLACSLSHTHAPVWAGLEAGHAQHAVAVVRQLQETPSVADSSGKVHSTKHQSGQSFEAQRLHDKSAPPRHGPSQVVTTMSTACKDQA